MPEQGAKPLRSITNLLLHYRAGWYLYQLSPRADRSRCRADLALGPPGARCKQIELTSECCSSQRLPSALIGLPHLPLMGLRRGAAPPFVCLHGCLMCSSTLQQMEREKSSGRSEISLKIHQKQVQRWGGKRWLWLFDCCYFCVCLFFDESQVVIGRILCMRRFQVGETSRSVGCV